MAKSRLEPGPFVIPMPTVLVGATVEGKPNFMPAAFVGIVNYKPVIVACGLNPKHHTSVGIAANGAFSLNLPSAELVEAVDFCGLNSGAKTDKSTIFEIFRGELRTAPMIRSCRLTAECRLTQTVEFEVDTVFFGEVVGVFADDDALTDGRPRLGKIAPLLFTFPDKGYWRLGEHVAEAWKVGKDYRS